MLGILLEHVTDSICVYTTRIIRNDDEHTYPKKQRNVEQMYPHIFNYILANT